MSDLDDLYVPVDVAAKQHPPERPEARPAAFGQVEVDWPDWYRPGRYRREANRRVIRGLHPFGAPLGPPQSKCGTCVHAVGGRWKKCELNPESRGPATDLVLRWRGCASWQFDPTAKMSKTCPECGCRLHRDQLGDPEGPPRYVDLIYLCRGCGGMFQPVGV